jgi:hypothetical protein
VLDRSELALYGLKNMAGVEGATEVRPPQLTQLQRKNVGPAPFIHDLAIGRPALRAWTLSGDT